jgi:protein involved in polysaccharide export with SLBB domain
MLVVMVVLLWRSSMIAQPPLDKDAAGFTPAPTHQQVYILGIVAKPGAYGWTPNMRVVQLMGISGGLLGYPKTILIVQPGEPQKIRKLTYQELMNQPILKTKLELAPNDVVIVF